MNHHPDFDRLRAARLHNPHALLGRHDLGKGRTSVRAWLPHAVGARLVDIDAPLEVSDGVFEWSGDARQLPAHYRLEWRDAGGLTRDIVDPYSFPLQLDDAELAEFTAGRHTRAHRLLGASEHEVAGIAGVLFAVWAPNAERVSVVGPFNGWDGRCHPMSVRGTSGVWELFIPGLGAGELYKFELRNRETGELRVKSDPYARRFEHRPATASIVTDGGAHDWRDGAWYEKRGTVDWRRQPMSIYELHLGSWRRGANGEFLDYAEIARQLGPYLRELGFTHVELLPITEHPLDASWGYQCTGYFAPTQRHGTPDELKEFVDTLHQEGIGVLLDWVPAHFPKDDFSLARFDGTPLYEYADARKGEHPDWGTLVFDFTRNEVQSFLLSSALYWLEEFHFDGLRVDAVASMLYLDYSRQDGEWQPNRYGGNENIEATAFLKRLNELTHGECPGSITLAEESTAWPKVSHPTFAGGLGFTFKWNMGWMHDTLSYMEKDPVHRRHHHDLLSFGPVYAFSENFVLPLSHDEVVHGKRSLLGKMPGDEWRRFANLRLLLAYQWTYPGKKLLFMGAEFGQVEEWNHDGSLPWHLADEPPRAGLRALLRDLNRLYRDVPALHENDHDGAGFAWLAWDDEQNSVLSFARRGGGSHVVVVLNFTPVPRHGYRVGVPFEGRYRVLLNTDSHHYGGSDLGNTEVTTQAVPYMGHDHSIELTLPPLAGMVLEPA